MQALVTALFLSSIHRLTATIITTTSGHIKGKNKLIYNQNITVYLGIRYGRAERFQQSEETSWNNVYEADKEGHPCPQPPTPYHVQNVRDTSEDCLILNIFSPNISSRSLPVMAFAQDMFYSYGSSQGMVDGERVAARGGVIAVTYQYRIGVLGFLNADKTNKNLGLLDSISALKWLQNNIKWFGGNPDDVTLVGHSSAAMAVGLLLVSPQAKGLFKRVIMMSGSPLSPIATIDQSAATINSRRIGKALDCTNITAIAQCLATKPLNDVIKAQGSFNITANEIPFGPVVDGDVIPDDPEKLFQSLLSPVDGVVLGVVEDDGKVFGSLSPRTSSDVIDSSINDVTSKNNLSRRKEKEIIKYAYTDWEDPTDAGKISQKTDELYTDYCFNSPLIRLADMTSKNHVPTFLYYVTRQAFNTSSGYKHGDELRALFGHLTSNKTMRVGLDKAFKMFVNFANSGNPSHPSQVSPIWPSYTPNGGYVTIGNDVQTRSSFLPQRMALWNTLLPSITASQSTNQPSPTTIATTRGHGNDTNHCQEKKAATKALTAVVAVMGIIIVVMLSVIVYQTRILGKRPHPTTHADL